MATFTMPPFTGGPEDDVFRPTEERDSIRGGGGMDTVDYSAGDEGVEVDFTSGRGMFGLAAGDAYSSIENAVGTVFNDRLVGRGGANTLTGGEGDDDLYGAGGADVLVGGAGDDTLGRIADGPDRGSAPDFTDDAGDDTMMGNAGFDMLYGGPGNDRLMGGRDDDEVRGAAGDDMLWGGADNDRIYGGAGNDRAWGGAGDDMLWGGDDPAAGDDTDTGGADVLWGNAGADTLMGGAGADVLWGNAGVDTLMGGAGADRLGGGRDGDIVLGGAGEDTLWGGAGDDTVYGGGGADTIEGGAGADMLYGGSRDAQGMHVADNADDGSIPRVVDTDMDGEPDAPNPDGNTVSYAGSDAAVTIDLRDADPGTPGTQMTASGGHAAGDVLQDFQSIRGSAHGDRLTGDDNANKIRGHAGDDVIRGGGSPSTTMFEFPDDLETVDPDPVMVTVSTEDVLWGGAGNDDIDGQDGPDDIIGGPGDDVLMGGPGDDTLEGGAGTDTIDGGDDNDTLSFRNSAAGVTVDLSVEADDDGYQLLGGDRVRGAENVMGSPHDDMLTVKTGGWTMIQGGAGDDTIVSDGSVVNTLVGGPGDDTYVINPSSTNGVVGNTITEVEGAAGGVDTIRFTGEDEAGGARGVGASGVGNSYTLPDHVENAVAEGNVSDYITGNALDNTISGGDGSDNIIGGPGDDVIDLGDGADFAWGNDDDDTINGGDGDDEINGGGGDDTLNGGDGDDTIETGTGIDVVDGGAGEDVIDLGLGDTVTGGPGKDSFDLRGFFGAEHEDLTWTITDFSTREEINVRSIGIDGTEMTAVLDAAEQIGDDVRLSFSPAVTQQFTETVHLVLEGVDLNVVDLTHASTSGTGAEFYTF